jgi:hypothetical protein
MQTFARYLLPATLLSGCLLLVMPTRCGLSSETKPAHPIICRPPANKECSEASTQHSTGTGTGTPRGASSE